MKVLDNTFPALNRMAYGILRHMPRLRLLVRKKYWYVQQKRYEQIAARNSVDNKLVFFEAFQGRQFADSPKAIYLKMLHDSRFSDYVFIWSFRDDVQIDDALVKNERTVCISRGGDDYFQALSQAKIIILNTRLPEYVYPKKDQIFVQCWHGTPLKRLGNDVSIETANALNTTSELAWRFAIDGEKWTFMLSASPFVSQHLADAFMLPEERRATTILEIGDPGNDPLAIARKKDQTTFLSFRDALGVPRGKKVLLYAPTWRDDSFEAGKGYTFNYLLDFDLLQRALCEQWVVLFRPHYYIANTFDFSRYKGFVIDVSDVQDINDCMLASDVLVTDYSSVMFDYCNTGNPLLLYVPDLDHYSGKIRDFYFDITDVPGPLCRTTSELVQEIKEIDRYKERYGSQYKMFLEQFCPFDDGNASKRVVDVLWDNSVVSY